MSIKLTKLTLTLGQVTLQVDRDVLFAALGEQCPHELIDVAVNLLFTQIEGITSEKDLIGRPMDEVYQYYTLQALRQTKGSMKRASKLLGVDRKTLTRWLRRWANHDTRRVQKTDC